MMDKTRYEKYPWAEWCSKDTPVTFADHMKLSDPVTDQDVNMLIQKSPNGKSGGLSGAVNEMWKHAPQECREALKCVMNGILCHGEDLPDVFLGGIIRILNKKFPLNQLNSWRPVTLLEVASKMLTKLVAMRLQRIAKDSGILSDVQEGFQPRKSTRRQLERLKQMLGTAARHGERVVLASIDFRSAFNSMDIGALLAILKQGFGLPDVDVLERLFKGAYFKVRCKQGDTAKMFLTRGTRQGCCLSPLIFTLCMTCLLRMVSKCGQAIMIPGVGRMNTFAFADDSTFVCSSVESLNKLLNGPLKDFCEATGMEINVSKSLVSGFDFSTRKEIVTHDVHYNGEQLRSVPPNQPFRYLGVLIRLDGGEKEAKEDIMNKVEGCAKRLIGTCYTRSQILSLANMCVWPKLRYGSPLFHWKDTEIQRLEKVGTRILKAAFRLPQSFPNAPFLMSQETGGMQATSVREILIKELLSHGKQCMAEDDELRRIIVAGAAGISKGLGGLSPQDVAGGKLEMKQVVPLISWSLPWRTALMVKHWAMLVFPLIPNAVTDADGWQRVWRGLLSKTHLDVSNAWMQSICDAKGNIPVWRPGARSLFDILFHGRQQLLLDYCDSRKPPLALQEWCDGRTWKWLRALMCFH
jgi:hypothetical protein